jgi:hypothetical protein
MPIHTIHHYEDQPELLRWIPGNLFNRFWSLHPDWIKGGGSFQEKQKWLTTFALLVDGQEHVIEYRLYKSFQNFEDYFSGAAKSGDIALADVMDKDAQPRGLEVYRRMVETLGSSAAVYLLTAFPKEVKISVPVGHILPKPVDASMVAELLFDKLAIGKTS